VARDLGCLVSLAVSRALHRLLERATSEKVHSASSSWIKSGKIEEAYCSAGVVVTQEDFEYALDYLKLHHSTSIGAPKIPNVR